MIATATVALLASDRATTRAAAILEALARRPQHVLRLNRELAPSRTLVRIRAETSQLVRRAWPRLTIGAALYIALLAWLLRMSLQVSGARVGLPIVVAALALDRVASMLPFTPGGAGVVEVGLTGLLIALGVDPVASASGVLLYRAFTYGLEIPVGGIGLAVWLWANRGVGQPAETTPI